jgi:RNA polymerase sigma factor (sigma-70 family)
MENEPTVFIVDDDPAVLSSLGTLIRIMYPRVETYSSANEFLAVYRPERSGCLVLDVAMPGMNGLELHRTMIERQMMLPVVFITGHGNVKMAVQAMQHGAVNFLEKPFRDEELWESIRKALEVDRQTRATHARRSNVSTRLQKLADGEREVLELILAGNSNREIAESLHISVRTVEDRRARVMRKMEAGSLAELVQLATTR